MARYYFDTDNGEVALADKVGLEFPNDAAARREAVIGLCEMIGDAGDGGDRRSFTITVRCEDQAVVYQGRMTFEGCWRNGELPQED
ncbi:DUF6894 family protein [Bosea sp. (in: a-proteobacteria)]|uniref:DUF6894 family protein n=1 Tax=Bosea sp. (in: a-proteobacteria) TaxID=1871050 RepID=UPI0039C88D33